MSASGKQLHEDAAAIAPAIVGAMNDDQRLAMAKVGLNALIDEATGFQRVRPVDALRTMAKGLATAIAEAPKRVQLSRRKGYRKPDGAVVVSRPSKWGNPFARKPDESPDVPVEMFRAYLQRGELNVTTADVRAELRGKDLACWCKLPPPGQPDICHGAVLLELANS